MARESYAALQAKIEKEINKLQKKAEVLQTKRRKPVITQIITSMREYDITPEEIVAAYGAGKPARAAAAGGRRKAGPAARPANAAKRAVAPKYRHPQTGETWSGRGKAPRWLAAEEAAGATRDSFLIKE
ncbi:MULTISPECIES: H-NS histone family protein [Achromobacter]|uniref:H-NS histone family protein n=1 Tax=Alcaligenes xylosoxydans xylosoxydans TaxID=85698 RepID=A0A424WFX7_ALCXX|nr:MULTISPECIES: H-NS histone family protein [Achromobacter]MBC9905445.1 H-NS histone family protein [Achromobacter xylosoxidans]MBD0868981.1 H-NS histone family protein [Achromobacter xylosoxidans]MDH1299494.1 H-NS histone family protein [Achromobacter sp. GD03932]QNP84198.1 H-NS histone family protein [Achromobacter xylosoxidans]RPJ92186.1 H-NS histone family protein [Achromobacter xylosoxidans]